MKVITSIRDFRSYRAGLSGSLGFVPTMGFLHEGHMSLVRTCQEQCAHTVVSIFVNPTQFGPNEDFECYPRDFESDQALCAERGVDCIFYPEVSEMYPPQSLTTVQVAKITQPLCGKSRPTHFQGVTTVVAKLFNIVNPQRAYFGQKDLQQSIVIRTMAQDLNMPIQIVVCPIFRENDGLAMSSRNKYLSLKERRCAPALYKALQEAKSEFNLGEKSATVLKRGIEERISAALGAGVGQIDYVEIIDVSLLEPVETIRTGDAAAVAVFVGSTRLIDNDIF